MLNFQNHVRKMACGYQLRFNCKISVFREWERDDDATNHRGANQQAARYTLEFKFIF